MRKESCSSKSSTVPPRQNKPRGRRSFDVPAVAVMAPSLTVQTWGSPSHPEKSYPLHNETNSGDGAAGGGVVFTAALRDCHHHAPPTIARIITAAASATSGKPRFRARLARRGVV